MKVLLLCNSDVLALPAILRLSQAGVLVGVVVPNSSKHHLIPVFEQFNIGIDQIHVVSKNNLEAEMRSLLVQSQADVIFTLTFPWKIPIGILAMLPQKCINFHFGILPKYMGADPIFWQLKNMEANGGISMHIMTEDIDNGPVLKIDELPIFLGETYGLYSQRLGALAAETVIKTLEALNIESLPLVKECDEPPLFFRRPTLADLTINWQQHTADEIQALVNASNPKYGGAVTTLRQAKINLLEVAPADVNNPHVEPIPPGTIIHADILYGLIVACLNKQFLKINVVQIPQGYMSGSKLFTLGFKTGEVFV